MIDKLNNNFYPEQYLLFVYEFISLYDKPYEEENIKIEVNKIQKYYVEIDKTNLNYYVFITKMLFLCIEKSDNIEELIEELDDSIDFYINYKNKKIKKKQV